MTVTPLARAVPPGDFDEFYRQYFVRVLMLIRRHFPQCDAEEIAQETMARCYTNFATLDPDRDPWKWVASVARNAAIDSLRRNRRLVSTDELPEAPHGGEDQTYDAVLVLERRRTVRAALQRLRAADRQLLVDHELEGMAYTEMAELRDMTPNALRQQLFRARGRLATELRRAGASLGVLPVAVHHRLLRVTRRCHDVSAAAGPAGASAFSALAVAGVATVATVLGGPGSPAVTAAAPPPSTGVVEPAERVGAPRRAATGAAAPTAAAPAAPPREPRRTAAQPPAPPLPTSIAEIEHQVDPTKPGEPGRYAVRVPTPVGTVYSEGDYGWLPGYGVLCYVGVTTCPERP